MTAAGPRREGSGRKTARHSTGSSRQGETAGYAVDWTQIRGYSALPLSNCRGIGAEDLYRQALALDPNEPDVLDELSNRLADSRSH